MKKSVSLFSFLRCFYFISVVYVYLWKGQYLHINHLTNKNNQTRSKLITQIIPVSDQISLPQKKKKKKKVLRPRHIWFTTDKDHITKRVRIYRPFSRWCDKPKNTRAGSVDQIDVLHDSLYNGTDCGILAIYFSCPRWPDDNDATGCVVWDNRGLSLRSRPDPYLKMASAASHTNRGLVCEYNIT